MNKLNMHTYIRKFIVTLSLPKDVIRNKQIRCHFGFVEKRFC